MPGFAVSALAAAFMEAGHLAPTGRQGALELAVGNAMRQPAFLVKAVVHDLTLDDLDDASELGALMVGAGNGHAALLEGLVAGPAVAASIADAQLSEQPCLRRWSSRQTSSPYPAPIAQDLVASSLPCYEPGLCPKG